MYMALSERSFDRMISPETLALISGRELLIQHLGHWPTFHDFEVLSLTLERALVSATVHDLRAVFMVFDLHKAPDDPERKQGSAEFLFENVNDLQIKGFNHQNPIMGLRIGASEPLGDERRFRVEWGGACMQHEVSFSCGRISVLRVLDLNPFRKALPTL
jgi:hypothetical protein